MKCYKYCYKRYHSCLDIMLYVVCVTAGYLMSYWNRPFFPEICSDATLDNSRTYDTMVRISGSWVGIAQAFKAVADHYGWTHVVVLSNDDTSTMCWYGAKPFDEVFGNNENYTFTWLRIGSSPSDEELHDILLEITSLTRGYVQVSCSMLLQFNFWWPEQVGSDY